MKSLVFASLVLVCANSFASELYSKGGKKEICSSAKYRLQQDFRVYQFDEKKCLEGDFEVTKTLNDAASGELTILNVKYSFSQPMLQVSGTATLIRNFKVDSDGQIKKSWYVGNNDLNLNDQRNFSTVFNQLLDELSFGNGDGYVKNVGTSFTRADAIKEIENALQDSEEEDGCRYSTTTSDSWALSDLDRHADDLTDFVKELKKQGKVKAVIARQFEEGESEYCSHYYFRILLNDGTYVILDLDFTT